MEENKAVLPRFDTLDKLVDFFDTHDMGDYAAQMPEAHFEVAPKRETRQDRAAIEQRVRELLQEEYHAPLPKKRLAVGTKSNGEKRYHEFDGVSPDQKIVFEVKSNQVAATKDRPAGRYFSAIKWALLSDVYLLSRIPAQTRLLVLTDKTLFDICREDMDGLLPENTQVIYRNPSVSK
jgi:hypothetical protein